jgi:hypothetical protein
MQYMWGRKEMHMGVLLKETGKKEIRGWEDTIKMDLKEVGWEDMDWIILAQDRDK